jgi:hypothetical protein
VAAEYDYLLTETGVDMKGDHHARIGNGNVRTCAFRKWI